MILRDKNILITGIDGFIGSSLAKRLNGKGAKIFGISKAIEKNNIYKNDITNFKELNSLFKRLKIHICFHLAGISLVEQGQKNPRETFTVNTLGAINILELTRIHNLERTVIASTSHVYGNNNPPFKEDYFPRPSRPYETSKACADLIAQSYADTFSIPVLIPRFTNIYGPGDVHFDRLIPKAMKSVISSEEIKLWGGNTIRDYLFIDDAIEAYVKLAEFDMSHFKKNRVFNFGSSEKYSVSQIVDKIIMISGKKIKIMKVSEDRPNEVKKQFVSFAKAREVLGWKPKIPIDEGLKKSYEWYVKNL